MKYIYIIVISIALASNVNAGEVNESNITSFTSGTAAVASEVNGNFTEHTIQINDNAILISDKQKRVTGTCTAGSISAINADGSVTCQEGTGISGGTVSGNLNVTGDLTVDGTLNANIDVNQITGLLGQGFTLQFPDIINNLVMLEILGVPLIDRVVIINGPGLDIERISGFDGLGKPKDTPGFSMEHDFIIETITATDANALKNYFDQYLSGTITTISVMAMIIKTQDGVQESFRWNMFEFKPVTYDAGVDGRTRFTFTQDRLPNTTMEYDTDPLNPFGVELSRNLETDTLTEISGITSFYPMVVVDKVNRTLTLTYDFVEGRSILDWVRSTVAGQPNIVDLALIELDALGTETSRTNFFGVFPIKYEQFTGYGMNTKVKARVTLSFNSSN